MRPPADSKDGQALGCGARLLMLAICVVFWIVLWCWIEPHVRPGDGSERGPPLLDE